MKKYFQLFSLLFFVSCAGTNQENRTSSESAQEVIYHVVQRSFFDSNGDEHGDLKGLTDQLDYLQELGITSILMLPLYESVYYHNYFASDFEKIDPTLGTMEDYLHLVKEVHRRGMKIYMDMETQYVTEDHLWYKDAWGNPQSPYSEYISFDDSAQKLPSTIVYDLEGLKGYDGTFRRITTVNMNSKKVWEYNLKLFRFFMDPNGDGDFSDGVDGFRLDHLMDDLDHKGRWTNLFADFWAPLIRELKKTNPDIKIMAEQADWGSFGFDYFSEAEVDWVFGFRTAFEIRNLDKNKLGIVADSLFSLTPATKDQIIFIENHDVPRFASEVNENPGHLRAGAALNLLLGGIPSIYYGQEIGMRGGGAFLKWGMTDANEIPEREAFEWYATDTGKGMAFWYRDSGPWWDSSLVKPHDGVSLEEQRPDPSSLFNFYKKMISLRKEYAPLFKGAYETLNNNSDSTFTFLRHTGQDAVLVAVNLSAQEAAFSINNEGRFGPQPQQLFGEGTLVANDEELLLKTGPHGINLFKLNLNEKQK